MYMKVWCQWWCYDRWSILCTLLLEVPDYVYGFWLLFKTAPWFWIFFSLDVGLGCCFVFRSEMSTDVNGTGALKAAQTEGCLLQTMQAIPGMLLALVLCFDHRKGREHENEGSFSRGNQYIRYAVCGYSIGLITALAAGLLSQLPQPALLYLVSSLWQLWNVLAFRTDEMFCTDSQYSS